MFEHLTPSGLVRARRQQADLRIHLGVFLAAVLATALLSNINQGPLAEANPPISSGATVVVPSPRDNIRIAAALPQVEIFRFLINTNRAGITLQKLKVYVNGLYDLSVFDRLKLYQNGSQLGAIEKYDEAGNIYYDLDSYLLAPGQNEFYFVLSNDHSVPAGQVIQLSLVAPLSIVLNYQGEVFSPRASYPLVGGTVSFTDHSSLVAYNISPRTRLLAASDEELTLAHLQLAVVEEKVDLQKLVLAYESAGQVDLAGRIFQLYDQDKLITPSTADNKQIVFNLAKPIVLGGDKHQNFIIKSLGLPLGQYTFTVAAAVARGYVTGQEVKLDRPLFLSAADVRPYYLEWGNGTNYNTLSEGWNKIFALEARAHGNQALKINKLSWSVVAQDLSLDGLELWVNDKSYLGKLVLNQDRLAVDLAIPIKIDAQPVQIKLLAKVKDMGPAARLQSYLLSDRQSGADLQRDNIIWSADSKIYNSHLLPDLPLAPVILTP